MNCWTLKYKVMVLWSIFLFTYLEFTKAVVSINFWEIIRSMLFKLLYKKKTLMGKDFYFRQSPYIPNSKAYDSYSSSLDNKQHRHIGSRIPRNPAQILGATTSSPFCWTHHYDVTTTPWHTVYLYTLIFSKLIQIY